MPPTAKKELTAIAKKQLAIRDLLWPGQQHLIWDRHKHKGFATIPKTMPLIARIMDEMTKGAPVSSTYLTLWCWTWDNSYAVLGKPGEMAFASGFSGQRGVHTWMARMKKLAELNFIDIKGGTNGPLSHAIVWNPHYVLQWHLQQKTPGLTDASYTALIELALDVGIKDLTDPIPTAPTVAPPVVAPVPAPASAVAVTPPP